MMIKTSFLARERERGGDHQEGVDAEWYLSKRVLYLHKGYPTGRVPGDIIGARVFVSSLGPRFFFLLFLSALTRAAGLALCMKLRLLYHGCPRLVFLVHISLLLYRLKTVR